MESIAEIKKHGGARRGAGRKQRDLDLWLEARGLHAASAAEILSQLDERRQWHRLFTSPDDGIVLRALMYLTDRRDGKAAQTINVTSQAIVLSAKDLESARAIIAEIRGAANPNLGLSAGVSSVPTGESVQFVSPVEASVQADSTARQGDAKVTDVADSKALNTQRA